MVVKLAVTCAAVLALGVGFHKQISPLLSLHPGVRQFADLPGGRDKPGWQMTMEDDFSKDTSLDTSKWTTSLPNGVRTHVHGHNHELEYYPDDAVRLQDGVLKLVAERRPVGGMDYTSGVITSFGKFEQKYGLYELRAKLPRGRGFWPAFWLRNRGRPYYEIDVFEVIGMHTNVIHQTNHYTDLAGQAQGEQTNGFEGQDIKQQQTDYTGIDASDGFHTYDIDWEPDSITFYVDGVETSRHTEGIPNVPMYVLVNMAVGGSWPGPPDEKTRFPSSMDLQWVRVYKKA